MTLDDPDTSKRAARVVQLTSDRLNSMTPIERDRMFGENLDEARPDDLRDRATRVIFEYGLDFIRQDGDGWTLATGTTEERFVSPHRTIRETGLRPVVVWNDRYGFPRPYVLPPTFYFSNADESPVCISQIYSEDGPPMFPSFGYLYFYECLCYHLRNLAVAYAWHARRGATSVKNKGSSADATQYVPGAKDIGFEVDAYLTAADRFYDALREPLWKEFGADRPLPDNNRDKWNAVLGVLPDDLREKLKEYYSGVKRIPRYRNFVEHCGPSGGRNPWFETITFDGIGIGASFYLPDNPNVREQKDATYCKRLDALTYCWRSADRLITLACEVFKAAGEFPSPYPYPDECY